MPRPSRDLAEWYCPRYHHGVASVEKIVPGMRDNPKNVRYEDLNKVCEYYFGPPRTTGGSHAVFKTPWPGDPRVNIQNDKGKPSRTRCGRSSRQSTRRRHSDADRFTARRFPLHVSRDLVERG
jgi:hypothetical protein